MILTADRTHAAFESTFHVVLMTMAINTDQLAITSTEHGIDPTVLALAKNVVTLLVTTTSTAKPMSSLEPRFIVTALVGTGGDF